MTRRKLSIFKHFIIIFFILISTSLLAQSEKIQYTLSIKDKNEILVVCDFNLKQPKTDSLSLIFPSNFGGSSDLFHHVTNIESLSEDLKLIPTKNNNKFICKFKSNNIKHVLFSYSVKIHHGKVLSNNFYEPFSKSKITHLIGSALFAYPSTVSDTATINVVFKKQNTNNTSLYSSNCKSIICKNEFNVSGLKALKESLYFFTNSSPVNINTETNPIFLFIPNIPNKKKYIATIKTATLYIKNYWQAKTISPYLMNITVFDSTDQGISYKGTCFDSGITFGFTKNMGSNSILLKHLFIHELCHNWIGIKFYPKYSENDFFWFTEGFTEFFTWEVLLKNNWITKKEYVNHYNETIRTIYLSKYRNAKYENIIGNFRSDNQAYQTLYSKGNLFAFFINNAIQEVDSSNSLKKIMLKIMEQNEVPFSLTDTLLAKYMDYALEGSSFQNYLNQYIYQGIDIQLPNCLFENKYCIDSLMLGEFQLGFKKNDSTNIVTQVEQNSAAYNAGVRKGAEILKSSIYYGHVNLPVILKIKYMDTTQKIEFIPQSINKIAIPTYINNAK